MHFILNHLCQTTAEGARDIVTHIQGLKVTDFTTESIINYVATFNAAIVRLERVGAIPFDLCGILRDGLRTSTVEYFITYIDTMEMTQDPHASNYTSLKLEANKLFEKLTLQGRWIATTKNANPHFSATGDLTQHKNPGQGQDGTNGRRFQIDRNAPAAGESHKRDRANGNGFDWWCKTCNRWGNHATKNHDPDHLKKKEAADALKKATKATQTLAKATKATNAAIKSAAAFKTDTTQESQDSTPPPDEDEDETPSLLSSTRTNPDFP